MIKEFIREKLFLAVSHQKKLIKQSKARIEFLESAAKRVLKQSEDNLQKDLVSNIPELGPLLEEHKRLKAEKKQAAEEMKNSVNTEDVSAKVKDSINKYIDIAMGGKGE